MYKIGFIGTGNMGSALVIAACNTIGAENVIITNRNLEKAKALAEKVGCQVAESNLEVAAQAKYIFLAVKPDVVCQVANGIVPALKGTSSQAAGIGDALSSLFVPFRDGATVDNSEHIVVSMAAGISTAMLKEAIYNSAPVIRIMPNTPAAVGEGVILLTGATEFFDEFKEIIAKAGIFEEIPENKFDYTSSISGCTPAYTYMFISALADGACQVGVPREQAIKLAAQAVLGAAKMVLETGDHPDLLKDKVCSPGGTTIVGVNALEKNKFRYGVAQSIIKSTEKNLEFMKQYY